MDYESNKSYIEMRSAGMSVASLVMGIIGLATGCCIYPAIFFGSLAIIFALLSRGEEMTTNSYAKAGLVTGIIGLIIGITVTLYSFITLLINFGGINGYLNYIEKSIMEEYDNSDYWDLYKDYDLFNDHDNRNYYDDSDLYDYPNLYDGSDLYNDPDFHNEPHSHESFDTL